MDMTIVKPLFGLGFVVAGTAAIIGNWRNGQKVIESQAWPSTIGRILSSEVTRRHQGAQQGSVYVAEIEYEYDLDGQTHRGRRVCVGGELHTSIRSRAESRCALYPAGAEVEVFHDPQRPEQACLERTREGAWLLYLIGNAFVGVGLLLVTGVLD